jgi:hypothetical protein
MAGYGYVPGTPSTYKAPRQPAVKPTNSLAMAAGSSQQNPFGFSGGPQNAGIPGSVISYGSTKPVQRQPQQPVGGLTAGVKTGGVYQPPSVNTAPTVANAYDINTDPLLQQVSAMLGMNDEQAKASALAQKQAQLLQYGDSGLAQSVLGDQTFAQAAGQNPTSTLAQLGQARDRNVHDLTENLNKANLLYGGYRVTQEQQAANDYQNQLAQAAASVNGNLGAIDNQLAQALGQNQAQKYQAMVDAYGRHSTDPGFDPSTAVPADTTGAAPSGGNVTLATAAGSIPYAAGVSGPNPNPNPTYAQFPPSPTNDLLKQLLQGMQYV